MTVTRSGFDPERAAGLGERGLEGTDERPEQDPAVRQPHDRVRHELARAVIGHLTAALDPHAPRCRAPPAAPAARSRGLRRPVDRASAPRGARGAAAGRRSVPPRARGKPLLEIPRITIADPAEPVRSQHRRRPSGRRCQRDVRLGVHGRTIAGEALRGGPASAREPGVRSPPGPGQPSRATVPRDGRTARPSPAPCGATWIRLRARAAPPPTGGQRSRSCSPRSGSGRRPCATGSSRRDTTPSWPITAS